MKREQARDYPTRMKRSQSSSHRYDSSPRDRGHSPTDRRDRNRDKYHIDHRRERDSYSDRPASRRDDYDDYSRRRKVERSPVSFYKVLNATNLNPSIPDAVIHESLMKEFSRLGIVSVTVCREGKDRFALLYFGTYEQAREAQRAKSRFMLHNELVHVDPVMDKGGPSSRRNRSITPEYSGHSGRGASPVRSSSASSNSGRRAPPPPPPPPPPAPAVRRSPFTPNSRRFTRPPYRGRGGMHRETDYQQPHWKNENKKEKFPNYLHHVPPEEDDKATRTLFVGNLEVTITDEDLKRIFKRYGVVEDIDVKRPEQGNAYAFIKFLNLDMAHRAKVEMSGQYIGKFQCKIGYGKATPSNCIWVGGLGSWTTFSHLEHEFDRFGSIVKIDYEEGKNHAYIHYDSLDAAQVACQEMRGFPLGGADRRIRVDFADPTPSNECTQSPSKAAYSEHDSYGNKNSRSADGYYDDKGTWVKKDTYGGHHYNNQNYVWTAEGYEKRYWNSGNQNWSDSKDMEEGDMWRKRPRLANETGKGMDDEKQCKYSQRTQESEYDKKTTRGLLSSQDHDQSKRSNSGATDDQACSRTSNSKEEDPLDFDNGVCVAGSVTTIQELAKCCPVVWNGRLLLKNSYFPSQMRLCCGDPALVESLMKDPSGEIPILRITQRLRLDAQKLMDVERRMKSAGMHSCCVLLAFAGTTPTTGEVCDDSVQQRPLRNLVSYLKQKEAAGVVSLPCSSKQGNLSESCAVLYAFPPCPFALDILRRKARNLTQEKNKEDHIIVLVIREA